MMIIEQTKTIKFDNEAERRRILAAFEFGPLQDKLLKILTLFENKEMEAARILLQTMNQQDQENLHWDMVDIIMAPITKPHITIKVL